MKQKQEQGLILELIIKLIIYHLLFNQINNQKPKNFNLQLPL
jgi:hypothetical protein